MGNQATRGLSDAAKKSGGTYCGMTIPVPALTNGLQGILRDENDDTYGEFDERDGSGSALHYYAAFTS